MKFEVIEFFKEFHDKARFVKNLNTNFLVLIPKKQIVEDVKDLRPISLVGGLYKILSKLSISQQDQKGHGQGDF